MWFFVQLIWQFFIVSMLSFAFVGVNSAIQPVSTGNAVIIVLALLFLIANIVFAHYMLGYPMEAQISAYIAQHGPPEGYPKESTSTF